MFKKYKFIIYSMILIVFYLVIQIGYSALNNTNKNDLPVISFDSNEITVSVKDKENVLLKGVKAYDEQDGDITDSIIIENISIFTSENTRSVKYTVFDNDGNVTTATRLIKYSDYEAPTFSMKDQLRNSNYSTSKVVSLLKANSCVDGDISNNITIMDVSFITSNQLRLKVSVSDSTNTTSYINLNYYLGEELDIEIVLKDYLIYLKQGESYDYRSNIINVIEKLYQNTNLIHSIDIDIPEMSKPGTYEVTYSIHRSNGNSGITKMIVIVE